MAFNPAPEKGPEKPQRESGIALFMVIAAMTVLSVLVTEFVYIAQVNQRMAYDGLDQIRALYLAKTGLKISLLRLKAYENIKAVASGAGAAIPRSILEKVWNFPFIFPFPAEVPGLTAGQKDQITKFQNETALMGTFTALIESESSKFNLNSILQTFSPNPAPSPSASPGAGGVTYTPESPNPGASAKPFDPEVARKALADYLGGIMAHEIEADPDFAQEYRDFKMADLMDSIATWADRAYQPKSEPRNEVIPPKKAPFYEISELHMVPGMTDRLYSLFAPALTVAKTPGINVNTMKEPTLRALIPQITNDEVTDFFKFRDSEDEDHSFKDAEDFYKYLQSGVKVLGSQPAIDKFKGDLAAQGTQIVTDETVFKITVQAQVNQATKMIEAWVELGKATPPTPAGGAPAAGSPSSLPGKPITDAGLRITFMRIL